jgi:hypothetical protein
MKAAGEAGPPSVRSSARHAAVTALGNFEPVPFGRAVGLRIRTRHKGRREREGGNDSGDRLGQHRRISCFGHTLLVWLQSVRRDAFGKSAGGTADRSCNDVPECRKTASLKVNRQFFGSGPELFFGTGGLESARMADRKA